ncbi:patatin family protein [uncultured Slackia sp.]|uniref:patatin-like phospholipase family protein n=1 Tax=uncultured Slackia sp. TaxID=665903 RepID=UPI0025FA447C|nr:patatin family protein [uncultured Slackia sp.]
MRPSYSPADTNRAPAWEGHSILDVNLVLEGGAMRAQFTAGVLDFFMDHDVWCKHVIGTSAGSLCGYNYVAGEVGRTCFLNTKYCDDPRYLSMRNFALTGNAIGTKLMFDEIPNEIDPFDYDGFDRSPMKLTAVSSDLELGEADYHVLENGHDTQYLLASSSLPLVSKIVEVDGKKLLDGGPCDSVPLLHSMLMGTARKHIVVLTQDATYRKKPNKTMLLVRRVYADYPLFCDRMEHRHFEYNRCYRWVERLHDAGEVFMIRPPEPVTVGSMERDPEKLFALYEQGYAQAAAQWDDLQRYLEK